MTDIIDHLKYEDFIALDDLTVITHRIDQQNNRMVLDMESELLLNKFTCPNGHALVIKSCSCADDIQQKNIILECVDNCEFSKFRSLDCGNRNCEIYNR